MDEELAGTLVALFVQPAVVGALIYFDRRRLDDYGRARMWNSATLGTAINPLLFPAPFLAFGAHVWVTRRGRWWARLAKALFGAAIATIAVLLGMYVVLFAIEQTIGFAR